MKLYEYLKNFKGGAYLTITGYCEEKRYDYYLAPLDEYGQLDESVFSSNNPNHYIPSCLEKEPWWNEVANREVLQWGIIGDGLYKMKVYFDLQ